MWMNINRCKQCPMLLQWPHRSRELLHTLWADGTPSSQGVFMPSLHLAGDLKLIRCEEYHTCSFWRLHKIKYIGSITDMKRSNAGYHKLSLHNDKHRISITNLVTTRKQIFQNPSHFLVSPSAPSVDWPRDWRRLTHHILALLEAILQTSGHTCKLKNNKKKENIQIWLKRNK